MSTNLIIGNLISVGAAVFTVASSLSHGRKKIYLYQTLQCLTMAAASVFFLSASGVTTFLLCAVRNYLVAYDRFTKKLCYVFLILIAVLGLISNNRGMPGLLPVVTTLIYTICSYLFMDDFKIKLNICMNLTLWAIYDVLILDLVSLVVDVITVTVTVVSIFKLKKDNKKRSV